MNLVLMRKGDDGQLKFVRFVATELEARIAIGEDPALVVMTRKEAIGDWASRDQVQVTGRVRR